MVSQVRANNRWFGLLALSLVCNGGGASELSELVFIDNSEVTVLTASRLVQPIMDAPNAITVLDRATIQASGYTKLADLLRLVPGIYVGHKRGWLSNVSHSLVDSYARRIQVLIDGRSVYLPSVGGTRWDTLPLAVDDIERIEVVRGPNAASFGANAFTGVINIITRHPQDVAGNHLSLLAGDHGQREAWYRWAGFSDGASHRVTLGHREDGGFTHLPDDERSNVFSYRGEFLLHNDQALGLQLGYMEGARGAGEPLDIFELPHGQSVDSLQFQADYRWGISTSTELEAKVYMNHLQTREDIPIDGTLAGYLSVLSGTTGADHWKTDILSRRWHAEIQLNMAPAEGVRTALGAFLRRDIVASPQYFATSEKVNVDSKGVFGHLEWRMAPKWLLNAGAFLEDYEGVGWRGSPRATLHWQPTPRQGFRVGISKAYRNPFAYEQQGQQSLTMYNANGDYLFTTDPIFQASGNVNPESFLSKEIGYLGSWPEHGLDVDVRIFRERVSGVINLECSSYMDGTGSTDDCDPELHNFGLPLGLSGLVSRDAYNVGTASQEGFESQVKWKPTPKTQVLFNYAYLNIDSHFDEKNFAPRHLAGVHLMHEFAGDLELTLSQYWTASFDPIGQKTLPASTRLDARIAKRIRLGDKTARLALAVQNLGGDYQEFSPNPYNLFDRRAYAQLSMDF